MVVHNRPQLWRFNVAIIGPHYLVNQRPSNQASKSSRHPGTQAPRTKGQFIDRHQGQHEADVCSVHGPSKIRICPTIGKLDLAAHAMGHKGVFSTKIIRLSITKNSNICFHRTFIIYYILHITCYKLYIMYYILYIIYYV